MTARACHGAQCVQHIAPTARADAQFCSEKCRRRDRRDRKRTGRAPLPRGRAYEPKCGVETCDRGAHAGGLCNRHYENLRRYGDPIPRRDRPLDERIREVGWTVTPSGCWEWGGKRNEHGYGIFSATRVGADGLRAHRVVYVHLTLADDPPRRHRPRGPDDPSRRERTRRYEQRNIGRVRAR